MYLNIIKFLFITLLVSSCSGREIDILNTEGKVVGGCYGGVDWHFYGMQDTIDYQLYSCYKESVGKGLTISDASLLTKDFTLPPVPDGFQQWNKKLAMHHYRKNDITEQKLGYILGAIEITYTNVVWPARDDLADGKISQAEFNKIEKKAKFIWHGQ
jgi:hypothetical protein